MVIPGDEPFTRGITIDQIANAIETSGLTKRFGQFTAVDGVDLKVREGEVYGLLGPNGSGKTTIIKMLCGLLKPAAGEMRILGKPAPDKKVMGSVGYMPQEAAIYMDNTVGENLRLFADIYGVPRDKVESREAELLKFVDLTGWKGALVSTLSGGMRHRASLACALVHEPRVLFLDEPTVGVDPELRATFWNYFNGMADKGVTVVITTHYMDEASHCTRAGLLRQGKLIAEGAPAELKSMTGTDSLEDAFLKLARRERP
ncbi:MAG: ABC transporter ATP-binding protein [Methanobacteriota archaeon]